MFKKSLMFTLLFSSISYAEQAFITISPTFNIQIYTLQDRPTYIEKGTYTTFKAELINGKWVSLPGTTKSTSNSIKRNQFKSASAEINFKNPAIQEILKTVKTQTQAYEYIVQNITYDQELADRILRGEKPNLGIRAASKTAISKKGVCYDYSLLFAALCRANGIECKVISGFYKGQGHAWNEINGEIIDTTLGKINPSKENYEIEKIF